MQSLNKDWWEADKTVSVKATLTFEDKTSIDVYDHDYIVEFDVDQDLSSANDKPTFDLVSDELSLVLLSLDNEFNPYSESGAYANKLKIGTEIDLYVRLNGEPPIEYDWDKINSFKVTEVNQHEDGNTVEIQARDFGIDIENDTGQVLANTHDIDHSQDVEDFFDQAFPGTNIFISGGFIELPKKLFPLSTRLATINEFLASQFSYVRCEPGIMRIQRFNPVLRGVLKDDENIISLSPELSLVKKYDTSAVRWNEIGSESGTLAFATELEFTDPSTKVFRNVMSSVYIDKLEQVVTESNDGVEIHDVIIYDVYSNLLSISVQATIEGMATLQVLVKSLVFNEITEGELDNDLNILELPNMFVQTKSHAEKLKARLDKFIALQKQYIGAEILFNPLLKPGDLLEINSVRYDTQMRGYIVEQNLSFTGEGFRQEITLLNQEAI